jgi:hypothetical protein
MTTTFATADAVTTTAEFHDVVDILFWRADPHDSHHDEDGRGIGGYTTRFSTSTATTTKATATWNVLTQQQPAVLCGWLRRRAARMTCGSCCAQPLLRKEYEEDNLLLFRKESCGGE